MRYFLLAAICLPALLWAAAPAQAQLSAGGAGQAPQPRQDTPDLAPPALPGAAGTPGLAAAPAAAKAKTGDPTTDLFAAVNNNDYGAAQDAVSRGADINAQNALGETPLDLSIALNNNSITFMLLSARNEGGGSSAPPAPVAAGQPVSHSGKPKPVAVKLVTAPRNIAPAVGNNPGTPDPAAGFLGFGPASK
jgi:hypothetical protein